MADESAEVTVNNNSTFGLTQPFKAETVSTGSETLEIKPISQTSNETLEIKPLSQTSSQTLDVKPLRTDSRQELAVSEPIRTDSVSSSNSTVDLKPVAFDVCMRTGPAPLPPTHVCEPYAHKIAFSLLGVEVFGVAWSGEAQTIVDDRPGRPVVTWGAVVPAPPPRTVGLPGPPDHGHDHGSGHGHTHHRGHGHEGDTGKGGLRIRLG